MGACFGEMNVLLEVQEKGEETFEGGVTSREMRM